MSRRFQRLVATTCALSLIACSSLQPLPEQGKPDGSRAQRQAQSVAVGDTLRVNLKNATTFDLVVTGVSPDSIAGTQEGRERQVLIAEVETLERRQFDVVRTALLIGSLVFIALGQYARGLSKLGSQ
jgi:hypothetical protein